MKRNRELDEALTELLLKRQLTVAISSEFNPKTLQIALYRRFQEYCVMMDDAGYLPDYHRGMTVSMVRSKDTVVYTFKKKKPTAKFTILQAPGSPDDKTVSANLEHNQEGSLRNRGASESSQEHGEDTHPSSSQGESTGMCMDEEDWLRHVRTFIQQDSSGQQP